MDVEQLARAQSVNRIAFGAGLVLAPGLLARVWAGDLAKDDRAKVLARSLGIRDLALGAGGVLAVRGGDREWIRRTFAAQALADALDFLVLAATPKVPLASRIFGGALAAGSAALAAEYARRASA
jgi:hypothetical protein